MYKRPSLFAVLTIHICSKQNLITCLCSKSGLAVRGFDSRIQILLEPNPLEYWGKPVIVFEQADEEKSEIMAENMIHWRRILNEDPELRSLIPNLEKYREKFDSIFQK